MLPRFIEISFADLDANITYKQKHFSSIQGATLSWYTHIVYPRTSISTNDEQKSTQDTETQTASS